MRVRSSAHSHTHTPAPRQVWTLKYSVFWMSSFAIIIAFQVIRPTPETVSQESPWPTCGTCSCMRAGELRPTRGSWVVPWRHQWLRRTAAQSEKADDSPSALIPTVFLLLAQSRRLLSSQNGLPKPGPDRNRRWDAVGALAAPLVVQPVLSGSAHAARAQLFIAIFSFIGNYWCAVSVCLVVCARRVRSSRMASQVHALLLLRAACTLHHGSVASQRRADLHVPPTRPPFSPHPLYRLRLQRALH